MPPPPAYTDSHGPQRTTTSPPTASIGDTSLPSLASSTSTGTSHPTTILSAQLGARFRGAILHNPFRKREDGGYGGDGGHDLEEGEREKAGWKGKKWWWKAGGGRVSRGGQWRVGEVGGGGDGGDGGVGKEDDWYWDYDEEEVKQDEDPPGADPPVLPSINVTSPFSAGFDDRPDGETTPTKRGRGWAGAEEEGEVEMLVGEPNEHVIPGLAAIDTTALLPTKRLPLVRLCTPKGSTFNLLQTPVPSPTLSARLHDDAEHAEQGSPSPHPSPPTASPAASSSPHPSPPTPPTKAPIKSWHPPTGWDKKFDPPQAKAERVWPAYIKPFQLKPASKSPPVVMYRRSFLELVKKEVRGKEGRVDKAVEVVEDDGGSAGIITPASPPTEPSSSASSTTSTSVRPAPATPPSSGHDPQSSVSAWARASTVSVREG